MAVNNTNFLQLSNVKIAGITAVVPKNKRNVEADSVFFEKAGLVQLAESTGVLSRRVVGQSVCASDLCLSAARQLLAGLSWNLEEIDVLIFVSQTPDYILPATACVLHGELGLSSKCIAFDINLGCSGYVYGLYVLGQLLESGQMKKGLLLVGDTLSKLVSEKDRSIFPLFGDAGTATALIYQEGAPLLSFSLGTDGRGAKHLIVPAGSFREPKSKWTSELQEDMQGNQRSKEHLFMDGLEVFAFTMRSVPKALKELLQKAIYPSEKIDAFVFHQANRFMLTTLQKKSGISEAECVISLDEYGNTSSASIPLAIAHRLADKIKMGPLRLVLAGFGTGFSWALVVVMLSQDCIIPNVYEYSDL